MSSTFADTLQSALGQLQPGDSHEISLKLKPLTAPASTTAAGDTALGTNPQLPQLASQQPSAAAGMGDSSAIAPSTRSSLSAAADLGPMAAATGASIPQGLTNAPLTLDTSAPLGSKTDSMYEAAAAQLAQAAQQRYMQYLQQLGYADQTTGQLIPGTLETEAVRQRYDLNRQILEAQRLVDEGATQGGTVFSGRRAQLQGLRTEPLYQGLANVDTDLQRQITEGMQGIGNLQGQFTVDRNVLIQEAAQRAQQLALQQAAAAANAAGTPAGGDPFWNPGGSPEDMARAAAGGGGALPGESQYGIPLQLFPPAQNPYAGLDEWINQQMGGGGLNRFQTGG